MSSIDNRIVNMKFNNAQFESGVRATMNTLRRLKDALSFKGAAKGMDGLNKQASRFNLGGIGKAIDSINSKFSAMGMVGIAAMNQLVSRAVDAGIRLTKALAIDPIMQGYQEYETKMGSIQTILANTSHAGTSLKDVTTTLDELNTYADKTIYNFADMTRNIGTFTAAGVDLETSTRSIKGIANLAAMSGSTPQQASTAMYQLSQAIASGTVKLMDWNSVVNAGMGGKVFQDALKYTAEAHGVNVDSMIEKNGSFRESLQEGWITAEVLTDTLSALNGDLSDAELKAMGYSDEAVQRMKTLSKSALESATEVKTLSQLWDTIQEEIGSGWARTFELIFGDFDEAKELFTGISQALQPFIGGMSEARNSVLELWKELGGRDEVIKGISNVFKGLGSVVGPIKDAFTDIFPPITGQRLFEMSKGFRELTEHFIMGEQNANNLRRTFKGVFAVFDIGWMALKGLGKGLGNVFKALVPAGEGFLGFTAILGDWVVGIRDGIKHGDVFGRVFGGLGTVIGGGLKFAGSIFSGFINTIKLGWGALTGVDGPQWDKLVSNIAKSFEPLKGIGKNVGRWFSGIGEAITQAFPALGRAAEWLGNALRGIGETIGEFFSGLSVGDLFKGSTAVLLTGGLTEFVRILRQLRKALTKDGGDSLADAVKEGVGSAFDSLTGSLDRMQQTLRAGTLIQLAVAIGILTASVVALSKIDAKDLGKAMAAIAAMMGELIGMMMLFDIALLGRGLTGMISTAGAMILLAAAVRVLSGAVEKMSGLDWNELAKGLVGTIALMIGLAGAARLMSGVSGPMIRAAAAMVVFGAAIHVLVGAVKSMSELSWGDMAKGLLGVGAVMAAIAGYLHLTKNVGMTIGQAASIVILAGALNILADAVGKFGDISVGGLAKGLGAMALVLLEVAAFQRIAGKSGGLMSTAAGMVVLGAAMHVFADAVRKFGDLSWGEIAKGLTAIAGALLIVSGAMHIMPKDMLVDAAALVVVAGALKILGSVMNDLGSMTWGEIAKGLTTLAGSLIVIAAAMAFMTNALPGAAALLVVSGALMVLAPVLQSFGNMSLEEIGKSLLFLAGALTVITLAGYALSGAVLPLLGFAAAVGIFGLAILAIGGGFALMAGALVSASKGIMLIAGALAVLAAVGVPALSALYSTIPYLFKQIGLGIKEFLGAIATAGTEILGAASTIIQALVKALIENVPLIIEAAVYLITYFVQALVQLIPWLVDMGGQMIIGILDGMNKHMPQIVDKGSELLVNFMEGLERNMPMLVDAGINLMVTFVESLANAIDQNQDRIEEAGKKLGGALIRGLLGSVPGAETAGRLLGESPVRAIIGILFASLSPVGAAAGGLGRIIGAKLREWVDDTIASARQLVSSAGSTIINGLTGFFGSVATTARNLAQQVPTMIRNAISGAVGAAGNLARGVGNAIVRGLTGFIGNVRTAAQRLARAVPEAIRNAISSAVSAAGNLARAAGQALLRGINNFITSVRNAAGRLGRAIPDGLRGAVGAAGAAASTLANTAVSRLVSGLQNGAGAVRSAVSGLGSSISSGLSGIAGRVGGQAAGVGRNIAAGIARGISSGSGSIAAAASAAASRALSSARARLAVKSPSREFMKIGRYSSEGLALGLLQYAHMVGKAGEDVADVATDAIRMGMRGMDTDLLDGIDDPVIKPVMDLSNVVAGEAYISGLSNAPLLNVGTTMNEAVLANQSHETLRTHQQEAAQTPTNVPPSINNFEYKQYNTSPKSLSHVDIYRQTRNQLSTLRGALNNS